MPSENITIESIICWSAQQVNAEVDGDVVLMSLEQGKYYGLDGIPSDIWRRVEQSVQVRDLVEQLVASHTAPRVTIERDVLRFLEKLRQEKLIDVS